MKLSGTVDTSPPGTVDLGSPDDAFSRGGNRLCFVHPADAGRCIKVPRADRLPVIKRRERSFPKNLKPLTAFDDNAQELAVYRKIQRYIGAAAFELIPRCHGYLNTNLGKGLCSDLVRDDDGKISITLKQYLWQHGKSPAILHCIQGFGQRWAQLGMPSRNLLLHNMVVQCRADIPQRLLVIDGLGWPDLLPLAWLIPPLARRKAARRVAKLDRAVDALLYRKEHNLDWGHHGWMNDGDRQ